MSKDLVTIEGPKGALRLGHCLWPCQCPRDLFPQGPGHFQRPVLLSGCKGMSGPDYVWVHCPAKPGLLVNVSGYCCH